MTLSLELLQEEQEGTLTGAGSRKNEGKWNGEIKYRMYFF